MKTEAYDTFWQRIHARARSDKVPLRVMFELTYRCNFKCAHCYVPASYRRAYADKELSASGVFRLLDELKDMGCLFLGFTGGEPFLRKDIMDILEYAKRLGFEVIVYTNGSLITERSAKRLSLMRLNKIDITIPALSESACARVTGVRGARDKIFRGIRLLHGSGVNLGFKSCVLKYNCEEIGDIGKLARSLGGEYRLDARLSPRLDGSVEPYRYGVMNMSMSFRSGREDIFKRCGSGISQAAITPSGELKACIMIDRPKFSTSGGSLNLAWQRQGASGKGIPSGEFCKCAMA